MASHIPAGLQRRLANSKGISRLKSLSTNLSVIRNLVFLLFLLRWTRKSFYFLRGHGLLGSLVYAYTLLHRQAYALFLRAPGIRSKVDQQVAVAIKGIEDKLIKSDATATRCLELPKEPWSAEQITAELTRLTEIKRTRWEEGRVSGAVYHGEDELLEVQAQAMRLFSVSNPIHADVFPAVRKMEAEVVSMVLRLFNAPLDTGAGATTSGGTESILVACLAARQKAYQERGVTEPEMIIPQTAHAAFYKASQYFGIKLHLAPCPAPHYRASIPHVRRLITPNTCLIVGSAPNYPHGIIDDIPALSKLALTYYKSHPIPLHVDCCLGSLLMPFLSRAGFPLSASSDPSAPVAFDFTVPGVTSISVDTHKYGFAPKGSSVVLHRTASAHRKYQYFTLPTWSGGVYGSPTLAGSRPGALIAGAWASLMAVGEKGYVDATHKILGVRQTIQNAIQEHPVLSSTLKVIGNPQVSVVAFESINPDVVSVYDIGDAMSALGYHLSSLQSPPALHIAVTLPWTKPGSVDDFIEKLVAVVEEQIELGKKALEGGEPPRKKGTSAALYGVAGSSVGGDMGIVDRLLIGYMDTLFKV